MQRFMRRNGNLHTTYGGRAWQHGIMIRSARNRGKKGNFTNMTKRDLAGEAANRRRPTVADPLGPNSEIGRKLKQYYDELVSDDIPDRFAALLAQLEKAEPAGKKD